ncbi:hypothetical protein Hokovirus_3_257 [Hokovirus HKV1]|uniref:HD domain-containing protein n=1 Tax=Hokovirus HKV1 TaxID=1977638 RepID=A0A1V0SH66_9VIRU|nr:hypothetical protein Hokovirus_3_257 [Hokovirus HKV1]
MNTTSAQVYNKINKQVIPKKYDVAFWKKLEKYVYYTCYDREDSHGHGHMKQVAKNSLYLWYIMNFRVPNGRIPDEETFGTILIAVAWLHDVADHKFDKSGILKNDVRKFLTDNIPTYAEIIMELVDRISFSKQKAIEDLHGKINWNDLLGEEFALIRNIVSDSDKIEAIGYGGITRCLQYGHEVSKTKNKVEVINHLKEHAEQKLLKLHDHYILTNEGKKISKLLHQEFCDILNNDDLLNEIYETSVA